MATTAIETLLDTTNWAKLTKQKNLLIELIDSRYLHMSEDHEAISDLIDFIEAVQEAYLEGDE